MENSPAPLLSVRNLSMKFGGIMALEDISFDIRPGEIVGLIGPNGAGKTTLFNCLNRIYIPTSGDILFEDRSILKTPPHRSAKLGISRTFQNLALFPNLSVLENVMVGGHALGRENFVASALKLPWLTRRENHARNEAMDLISFLSLDLVARKPAAGLSYGVLKRVEVARAMAAQPKLLLLDEPAAGLSQAEISELQEMLIKLRVRRRTTQLLVEHHLSLVMALCDRIIVLDAGRKIADDTPANIRKNPEVIRAYLGGEAAN